MGVKTSSILLCCCHQKTECLGETFFKILRTEVHIIGKLKKNIIILKFLVNKTKKLIERSYSPSLDSSSDYHCKQDIQPVEAYIEQLKGRIHWAEFWYNTSYQSQLG